MPIMKKFLKDHKCSHKNSALEILFLLIVKYLIPGIFNQ